MQTMFYKRRHTLESYQTPYLFDDVSIEWLDDFKKKKLELLAIKMRKLYACTLVRRKR